MEKNTIKSFNELKRNLKKDIEGFKKIRLALLSDSASQLFHTALKGTGIENNLHLEIFEAGYNQIDFQIFNPESELYESKPDFIIINLSSERLLSHFYELGRESLIRFALDMIQKMRNYVSSIENKLRGQIIINTLPEINDSVFGSYYIAIHKK